MTLMMTNWNMKMIFCLLFESKVPHLLDDVKTGLFFGILLRGLVFEWILECIKILEK